MPGPVVIGGASVSSKRTSRMNTQLRCVAASGCKVLLQDDRWYTDWQMGLHGAIYGYAPGWWKRALHGAVDDGPASSIAYDEAVVATMLAEGFYPDIEAIRFMPNGSDACAGAMKLARAITGRDRLLVYGYHGTASAWATPPATNARPGMPAVDMRRGTLRAERDALMPLEWLAPAEHLRFDDVAAVVIEAPTVDGGHREATEWLNSVWCAAHAAGALFVLDEVVTGFRYGPGGASEYYDLRGLVDLYCFGKTLGNGYPVAALAGKQEIMGELANGVHMSGTFYGEPLGLAVAKAMLRELRAQPPWSYIAALGRALKRRWNTVGLPWQMTGHPTRPHIELGQSVMDPLGWNDLRVYLFARGHIVVEHPWYIVNAMTTEDVNDLLTGARQWMLR